MQGWLDELLDDRAGGDARAMSRIDTWLDTTRAEALHGERQVRIVDLTAPRHDDMSLYMVVLTDTRPESVALVRELLKQRPDRTYRDRKGRTATDLLRAAMAANPGNAVLQEKYDLHKGFLEQAADVNRLVGLSKYSAMGKFGRDPQNIVASMLTGQEEGPLLIQKSKAMSKAGLPGVKGARRSRKARKTRKGNKQRRTTRRR